MKVVIHANTQEWRFGGQLTSLFIHALAFAALIRTPAIRLPEAGQSEYKQAIEGKEDKLVWFKFNKDLPDVRPPVARKDSRPLRAETRARQEIVASRKDAPKQKQVVWMQAPELKDLHLAEMPNVLAVRLPKMARAFTPPPLRAPAPPKSVEAPPEAPRLATPEFDPITLAAIPRVAKPFVVPPKQVPPKVMEVAPAPEAPQVEARLDAPALDYKFKAPPRPFSAPPKAQPAVARAVSVDAPPALNGSGPQGTPSELLAANSRDLNLAVVGLNPADKPAALPANSSPGQFSAGPQVRPQGADSAGGGNRVNVPDLYVRGSKEAKPDLIAQAFAAPTAASNLRAAARLETPRVGGDSDQAHQEQTGAVKVTNAPDRRFDGRDVYMMAIQMPNLTSYSGSWLMWYADRTAREAGLSPVAPPVAHRKVDPKYIASAAADRVEGKIQLACVIDREGHVSTVELIRGLDERLDRSAQEALAKWEFTPATRQGEPVAVDVLVEIPFRLAPRSQVKF